MLSSGNSLDVLLAAAEHHTAHTSEEQAATAQQLSDNLHVLLAAVEQHTSEEQTATAQQLSDNLHVLLAAELHEQHARENEMQNHQIPRTLHTNTLQFHLTVQKDENQNLFKYYTGFTAKEFNVLCTFFEIPLVWGDCNPVLEGNSRQNNINKKISAMDQFCLALMRFRNNFDMLDLAFRFHISQPDVSFLIAAWINYLYSKLAVLPVWPHRNTIKAIMPPQYRKDFPSTFAIIDCTELKIQRPNSLKLQSQCYSDYKGATTVKGLVTCDPLGSLMFASKLFTGSISDKEIFQRCGLKQQLQGLLRMGYLLPHDGLMCDKGFKIAEDLNSIGLELNLPPFAKSGAQMSYVDVNYTKKIAKHRVHVERLIGKIKNFKIFSYTINNTTLATVDKMWFVCCMLTNFQPPLIHGVI